MTMITASSCLNLAVYHLPNPNPALCTPADLFVVAAASAPPPTGTSTPIPSFPFSISRNSSHGATASKSSQSKDAYIPLGPKSNGGIGPSRISPSAAEDSRTCAAEDSCANSLSRNSNQCEPFALPSLLGNQIQGTHRTGPTHVFQPCPSSHSAPTGTLIGRYFLGGEGATSRPCLVSLLPPAVRSSNGV